MMSMFLRPSVAFVGAAGTVAIGTYLTNTRRLSSTMATQYGNRFVPVERSGGGI